MLSKKKMAILTLTPEALKYLLHLPDGLTFVEARIPFEAPGGMEIKVEGGGWETPEGYTIKRAKPATVIKKEDGTIDIDWGLPEETKQMGEELAENEEETARLREALEKL